MNLLDISEKLERLVARLPEPLRKPLLREITPVKDLFLRKRAPKLLFLGSRSVEKAGLINALFGCEASLTHPFEAAAGYWQSYFREGRGTLQCLDARNLASLNGVKSALVAEPPDLIILLKAEREEVAQTEWDHAEAIVHFMAQHQEVRPPLIGVVVLGSLDNESGAAVQDLRDKLRSFPNLSSNLIETLGLLPDPEPPSGEADDRQANVSRLAEAVAFALPDVSKLEMARLSGVRSVQVHIAQILIRSMTAASGAIGAQPIPLADFPILTTLQGTMVAGIMIVSGRPMTAKLAAEFIAALGANIGAGLFLREGARAALKLLPGWGNAISGAIASAGTYAVGRSATAYFIEGSSLAEARKLFRRSSKSAIEKRRIGR